MLGILIVSDVQIFREGLALALSRNTGFEAMQAASRPSEVLRVIRRRQPRVALIDLTMPGSLGIMSEIARAAPSVAQVAMAVPDVSSQILSCAEAGAVGFVPRDASLDDLVRAIHDANAGSLHCRPEVSHLLFCHVGRLKANGHARPNGTGLTPRESQILELIECGQSNKVIATALGIEVSTVKNHVHSLLSKLGVRRRGEAAALHRRQLY